MTSSKVNNVTLFSNGIGHFRREYDVPQGEPLNISIPFKKDHIGDVAASLQVFGKVKLASPPSFTPSNSDSTALEIDQHNSLRSLLTNLSGAKVQVGVDSQYILVGVDVARATNESREETFVVLSDGGHIVRKSVDHLSGGIEFVDESVRAEIQKALNKNFQRIKPDSTFLDLELVALEDGAEAQIQYTIPVAAWKMRYSVRQHEKAFALEGAAIIDNNTDEDWRNFQINVVTGNPISFQTNIAAVVEPQRRFVSVVDGNVLGHVDVEEGYPDRMGGQLHAAPCAAGGAAPTRAMLAKASVSNRADFGLEGLGVDEAVYESTAGPAAESPGMESKDVGDFCVFSAKEPITILSRKSAVVPMFHENLENSGVVLYYKQGKHAKRPYRTIKFKNETSYSLGRGKMAIYNAGVFSGECVLENTKPGENRVLPHCLENGVKIMKEVKSHEDRQASLKIAEGVAVSERTSSCETLYHVSNKKDEDFKFLLEHDNQIHGSTSTFSGVKVEETERVEGGVRAYFVVPANESVDLTVNETLTRTSQVNLERNSQWLISTIDVDHPISALLENERIQECIRLTEEINDVSKERNALSDRVINLENQAERVRNNILATKDTTDNDTISDWVKDLDSTEKEIRRINEESIPQLDEKQKELQKRLNDALKSIAVAWTSD